MKQLLANKFFVYAVMAVAAIMVYSYVRRKNGLAPVPVVTDLKDVLMIKPATTPTNTPTQATTTAQAPTGTTGRDTSISDVIFSPAPITSTDNSTSSTTQTLANPPADLTPVNTGGGDVAVIGTEPVQTTTSNTINSNVPMEPISDNSAPSFMMSFN